MLFKAFNTTYIFLFVLIVMISMIKTFMLIFRIGSSVKNKSDYTLNFVKINFEKLVLFFNLNALKF